MNYYIKNAKVVNEDEIFDANVLISDGKINKIDKIDSLNPENCEIIDIKGKFLIPGIIDEHVHFREPGLTTKADIFSESMAAAAGGVTSFMDMPNTNPQTTTQTLLSEKFALAAEKSLVNFSFYIGATNDNFDELIKTDPSKVCGIKLFMGSSTGNMLLDDDDSLNRLFRESPCLIAAHCEDEPTIQRNTLFYKDLLAKGRISGDASIHPEVRTSEACFKSSSHAVELAEKYGARLHVMHISTEDELSLFRNDIPLKDKKITAETCPHYLFFDDRDYEKFGFAIKCNPAIKSKNDKFALISAVKTGLIDTIGTDHAPHLRDEKFADNYFAAKSGFPSIQNSFDVMYEIARNNDLQITDLVRLMCHNPASLYKIDRRGYIKEGFFADVVVVDLSAEDVISNDTVRYKCGWTPYDGVKIHSRVTHTFVNGNLVFENGKIFDDSRGVSLKFADNRRDF